MALTEQQKTPPPIPDWDEEDAYWEGTFASRPYAAGTSYDAWRPAYRFGHEAAQRYPGRKWIDVERDLERDWDTSRDRSDVGSTWEQIKNAVRDAWDRVTGY